jgi:hypothetical protein
MADQDSWDRYAAASRFSIRRWLDANPHDELADEMRAELASSPAQYARYWREYLGWGVTPRRPLLDRGKQPVAMSFGARNGLTAGTCDRDAIAKIGGRNSE